MKIEQIAKICSGQDGAVWGRFLFRFKPDGWCYIYELEQLKAAGGQEVAEMTRIRLDKAEILAPHSNAVVFGNEYAEESDEFPLLYTNIYNNYAKEANRLEGVCCVYRLWRTGTQFYTKLVQLIEVGFTADAELWCSPNGQDVRPYGNFVIDRETGVYYAFTMRDADCTTRYFAFRLPKIGAGHVDERFGVRKVALTTEDVLHSFDCDYHHYLQGACVSDGLIYSLEGFTDDANNPPVLRIVSPVQKKQLRHVALEDYGLHIEPEFIDFSDGVCYYGDHDGNLYMMEF